MDVQYRDWLGQNPLATLVSREEALEAIKAAAEQNLAVSADSKPFCLNAGGPSGCGKTRLGYEAVRWWKDVRSCQRTDQGRGRDFFIPLFIDFANGLSFQESIDAADASECLGARIAAKALSCSLRDVYRDNGKRLSGLDVRSVLEALVLRCVDHGATLDDQVLIGLHLDEYQDYLELIKGREDVSSPQQFFKEMLNGVSDVMRDMTLPTKLGVNVAVLPVITGTPYRAVDILWTKFLQLSVLETPNVDLGGAVSVAADVFAREPVFANHHDDILKQLASSSEICAALLATGYRPRLIVNLADWACKQAVVDVNLLGVSGAVAAVNWQSGLDSLKLHLKGAWDPSVGQLVARVALLRVPVRFVFGEGEGPVSPSERAVHTAESRGEVELAMVPHGQRLPSALPPGVVSSALRVVILPWVQQVLWGVSEYLPPRVREISRARWSSDEQELYIGHLTAARMTHWGTELRGQSGSVALADIFPGALGSSSALNLLCLPQPQTYRVYREKSKFLIGKTSQPSKQLSILSRTLDADVYQTHTLTSGVFLARECNFAVDCRTSIPLVGSTNGNVHIEIQAKQSQVATPLTYEELSSFVNNGRTALKEWSTDGDRVVLVMVTTRPVTEELEKELKGGRFFQQYPELLVISKRQMPCYLPPDLCKRALG